jgi:transcriptional regulator with XRE-family HTH domain
MKKRNASARSVNSIDQHFGERIRNRRNALNMSQVHLASKLGVSYQQIQKYEAAVNRISAARLYEICQVFDVPIASMFENILAAARPAPKRIGPRVPSKKTPSGLVAMPYTGLEAGGGRKTK